MLNASDIKVYYNILLLYAILGAITNAPIQLDPDSPPQLADRDNLVLVIEGLTTGSQATSVTWRRNNVIVDRNTRLAGGGSFYDGGGDAIVGTGPCESHMYRVALQVRGYLPGTYTYSVSNANTPTPVTSPLFTIKGNNKQYSSAIIIFPNVYLYHSCCGNCNGLGNQTITLYLKEYLNCTQKSCCCFLK